MSESWLPISDKYEKFNSFAKILDLSNKLKYNMEYWIRVISSVGRAADS